MKKMVNGEEIECSIEEAAEIQAEWSANALKKEQEEIKAAKETRKEELRREKLDSMLSAEISEIDAAQTKEAAKAVKLK